jgi:hypothetical protein
LRDHHKAWLAAHPDRSADWLKRMLVEGFQVHHIDGDHDNNHPSNLALIEGNDHMRLHGLFSLIRTDNAVSRKGGKGRWANKTAKEKSAHMRMMVMARTKKRRERERAARLSSSKIERVVL